MKRKNYKRKLISYLAIWSVFISSILLYSSEKQVVQASGVPEIVLDSPANGAMFQSSTVKFTGTISDETTLPDKLIVNIFEQQRNSEQLVDITNEGTLTITPQGKSANFSFVKDFNNGAHNLTFIVTDEEAVSNKVEKSFTIDVKGIEQAKVTSGETSAKEASTNQTSAFLSASVTTQTTSESDVPAQRPYLEKIYLIPKDAGDDYKPQDVPASYLPAEDMTRVPLGSKILIDIRSTEKLDDTKPLLTTFGAFKGEATPLNKDPIEINADLKSYVYIFTPEQDFLPGTTYNVYLNPSFSTVSGIGIVPRYLKFTTVSNYEGTEFEVDRVASETTDNDAIHGPFSMVTNACSFCHSTHNGNDEFLMNAGKGLTENDMCMTCHDGTNSPKIEDNAVHSKHFKGTNVTCSSCHDPHNPGAKENPNSLYPRPGTDPFFNYKKAGTVANDATSDYSLCLNCHNGSKGTDIKKYYVDGTLKSESKHNIAATIDSGSKLNGQLPCAECHETHGASNVDMLRTEFGNVKLNEKEKPKTDEPGDNWFSKEYDPKFNWDNNADAQRKFCLSCHNDNTVLYGKTVKALNTNVPEHGNTEKKCSECHSTSGKFIEAAHAPSKR